MIQSPLKRYFHLPLSVSLLAGAVGMPLSGFAQTTNHFSSEQRKEIVEVVRDAMKKDPSILEDAVIAAQQERTKQKVESATKTLADKKNILNNVLPTDGFIGNPNAKNTIVEFFDPRCGYCKKVLPELLQLVKEDKNVRIIFKVVPILGENSVLESKAIAAAARQNGYVVMMKAIMDSKEEMTEDSIKELAKQQKLDGDRLIQDMKAASITQALEDNIKLFRDLGIDGTPALIINGSKIIPGAVSYETLKQFMQDK
ncbi:DsbA family protein [Commensalibacter papalotli (ex Botero et al. 2024)]|uniref:Protein thiol-disulfide isomerase DsbC (DsbG) (PDB:2HI7) n=1 Tax=Commensalibacter papalotli (ex Botero et al. 2024) TaxID=2972766 RepID=A0ABM9HT87_9PROT|nr:DsbA family protein [Commensalibacter papalotli (ex Botero et al. 2024)]CAI3953054.1 Protein thiol-disulfide isomerase DsbC (DsbG) (PDB:2HI7) [Commensalibacter papalotli (ex Botero et al. 2024)]CAI3953586.1 Protein thiol-disulfide isomerase DsbC (DsbG) (PDB:2HI7) [Commensalibacter papalotli (ex Botero et al. 2024)]